MRRVQYTRWQHFETGFRRLGFEITERDETPEPHDVLVIWNRFQSSERWATRYEKAGATVLVAENGWIGDIDGCRPIALARSHHNGAGWWPVGDEERWSKFGVTLAPWRENGEHILVLAQRGFGEPGIAMPPGWVDMIKTRLRMMTRRKIVVRLHPGTEKPQEPDFAGAWAAVTWASGAAIKALAAGVPVLYEMPKWIGAPAARYGIEAIEDPFLGDRMPMFHRLSYAQFSPFEIETGEPLTRLID